MAISWGTGEKNARVIMVVLHNIASKIGSQTVICTFERKVRASWKHEDDCVYLLASFEKTAFLNLIKELNHKNFSSWDFTNALNALKALQFATKKSPAGTSDWKIEFKFPSKETERNIKWMFEADGSQSSLWERRKNEYINDRGLERSNAQGALSEPATPCRRYCNLPIAEHKVKLVGRDAKLRDLQERLSSRNRFHIVTIDGIGGVGKTALAIEAAYRCLKDKNYESDSASPTYEAVVFVSFKEKKMTHRGLKVEEKASRDKLREIFRAVAKVLETESIIRTTDLEEQQRRAVEAINNHDTLLILDDLQSITSTEEAQIFNFLGQLLGQTKIIITTRKQRLGYSAIRLNALDEEDSLKLIKNQAFQRNIEVSLQDAKELYQCYKGVPLALVLCVGRIASGYSIKGLVNKECPSFFEQVSHFCFSDSIEAIRDDPAYSLLLAISIFYDHPKIAAALQVAGLHTAPISIQEDCWVRLKCLSLVEEFGGRYKMNSLIREYTRAELSKDSCLEDEMTDRWIGWYIEFSERNGGTDWNNWYIPYDLLEQEWENILSVLDYCAQLKRYNVVKRLWSSLNHFADLYGHWDDRLYWLSWLIEQSEINGDFKYQASALSKKAWTLTMKGGSKRFEEAEGLFDKAWELKERMSPIERDYLIHNMIVLLIRQGRYSDARIKLAEKEINHSQASHGIPGTEILWQRCRLNSLRDKAKLLLKEGKVTEAKVVYKQFSLEADQISWKRGACYARNQLAEIDIQEGDLESARKHLDEGLPVAKINKNKRRLAFYNRSYGLLERSAGNIAESNHYLALAQTGFNCIGMQQEEQEMINLLSMIRNA